MSTPEKPREHKGLEWYWAHWSLDGRLLAVLYRPVRGPWTDAHRNKVPSYQRGYAKDHETPGGSDAPGDVTGDGAMLPLPSRHQRQGIVRAELKARQGRMDL